MSPRSQILRLAKTLSHGNEKHQTFPKDLLGSSRGKKDDDCLAIRCLLLLLLLFPRKHKDQTQKEEQEHQRQRHQQRQKYFLFDPSMAFVPK